MSKTKAHQRYRLKDRTIVPGVTTIVGVLDKPALVPWANRRGLQGIDTRKYVDDKADIGTLAHAMIIDKLLGRETDTADYSQNQIDAAENACLSFYEWQNKHNLMIVNGEYSLVSETHKFGGQYDIFGIIDGHNELLDLKTGSGIWEEHYYQLGGYLLLLDEYLTPSQTPDRARILNVPRTESETFQEVVLSPKVIELAKEQFLDCLRIYNRKKAFRKLIKRG
jgi:hypothetical protein